MRVSALLAALGAGVFAALCPAAHLTQADLIDRLIDLDRLTTPPPAGERTGMFSSYDRRSRIADDGTLIDWDANGDAGNFVRTDDDGWQVMAELDGPGALTRIWSANPHGQFRIVLDGATVVDTEFGAFFQAPYMRFIPPAGQWGATTYMPIGFSESCRVLLRDGKPYYQVNYVRFPAGTTVQRFDPALDEAARAAHERVAQVFGRGPAPPAPTAGRPGRAIASEHLRPGGTFRNVLEGAGTLRGLYVGVRDGDTPLAPYALHRCVLRIWFDGYPLPCVEAPLIDFFGSGFDRVPSRSLPLGTDLALDGPLVRAAGGGGPFLYCHWPMPFVDGAIIEIANLGEEPVELTVLTDVDPAPPAADALRFHARFRREDPCKVFDYLVMEARGPGRIVGCLLNIDTPRAEWWGEGDEKIWIDGERFPTYFGTGTEDYLNDAWGLRPHRHALHGVTRAGAFGKASAFRWHTADCINFQQSVRFTLENYAQDTYYATVAYWYAPLGSGDGFARLTADDLRPPPLRVPGAIEAEHAIPAPGGPARLVTAAELRAELSGGHGLRLDGNPVTLTVPVERAGPARLELRVPPGRPFAPLIVRDQHGRLIGTVSYDENSDGLYLVGVLKLAAGENPLQLSGGGDVVLDCWRMQDVPRIGNGHEAEDLPLAAEPPAPPEVEWGTPWSGGGVVELTVRKAPVTFRLPAEPAARHAALTLLLGRHPGGGNFQALVNDEPVGRPFDTRGRTDTRHDVSVGTVAWRAGENTLTIAPVDGGGRLALDALALRSVRDPRAIEFEQLEVLDSGDCPHGPQPLGGLSNEEHIFCRPERPGGWIEVGLPVATAGRYRLSVVYTTSFDYGIVETQVNGVAAGTRLDTFGTMQAGPLTPLGEFDLPAGVTRIRVTVVDKHERSRGYFFGLDCLLLEPVDE